MNKKNRTKQPVIIQVLLSIVVIMLVFSLFSCSGGRKYDEAEVKAAAEELIRKSERLNEIYYGEGIRHTNNLSDANGDYFRADSISLSTLGVYTLDDIKELTYSTFTREFSDIIIATKLSSVSDEDGIQSYARYYQKYNALDGSAECIMVFKNAEVFLKDQCVYDYSTLKVLYSKGESIFVSIDVTVTNEEGESRTSPHTVELIEEADGFRVNSPTYKRYVDEDYYNELQNNKK